jgi:phosphate transport system protein
MTKHLLRDLDDLRKKLLLVSGRIEVAVQRATTAFLERRPELAREVIDGDDEIDHREVEIEEDCLKLLALHQPVAADLRYVIAVLKVNNDLERMGDLAVNIAERALGIVECAHVRCPAELAAMVKTVQGMIRDTMDALIRSDVEAARRVRATDQVVDDAHRMMFHRVRDLIVADLANVDAGMLFLSASRHLERIADQCTNIAEDVIFMVEGEIVRHRGPPTTSAQGPTASC